MNGLDDLLDEVLREDGNQRLPPGMKKRILAALPVKTNPSHGRRAMWVGVAAAMLVGIFSMATWTPAPRSGGPIVATDSDHSSLVRSANSQALGEASRTRLLSYARKSDGRKSTSHGSIRIDRVVIEPLVIEPIEIASVASSGSTMKGKLR
jgi:hypothetical protein